MKKLIVGFIAALCLASCGGGGDATCCTSAASFTSAQCSSFAVSYGCSSGEAQAQTCGGKSVQGCAMHGCPDGVGPMCMVKP